MRGHRSRRTYAFRSGGECWAFVPHPNISGLWMRLHPSVLIVKCPYEECRSSRGVPCRGRDGYIHYVHADRRRACTERYRELEFALGIVATIEK